MGTSYYEALPIYRAAMDTAAWLDGVRAVSVAACDGEVAASASRAPGLVREGS